MKSPYLAVLALALGTTSAFAADLPQRAYTKAPEIAAAPSWTGFYAGIHAGWVGADVSQTQTNGGMPFGPYTYSPSGGFGGGTFGYNWQFAPNWLVGIEGDVGYIGLNGDGIIPSSVPTSHQDLRLSSGVYGDITGRLGFTFDRFMLYGKGGWAWFNGRGSQTTTNPGYVTNQTGQFSGWTAGAGAEYLLSSNLSVKVEYQHFDFGSQDGSQTSVSDFPIGFVYTNNTKLTLDTVKAGLNYKFGF